LAKTEFEHAILMLSSEIGMRLAKYLISLKFI
jgi:hypothetical protein